MGRTVLITGGCGFIGRHVSRELLDWGYDVRLFDSMVEQVHAGAVPDIPEGCEFIPGDVRDRAAVEAALRGATDVIHLAAEVGVGQSQYEIARYVGANDLGTAVLLEAMIDAPVERIVVASSMSVYGEGLYVDGQGRARDDVVRDPARGFDPVAADGVPLQPSPTPETKPVDLASIYALTKFAQERAVLLFGRAYERKAVALRLFNVYGAGQALANPYTGVLANFASRIANNNPPLVFEDGMQRRDFVHVRDVARAFRLALEAPASAGGVFNIGSGRSWPIVQIARLVAEAMGEDIEPEILGRSRSGDIRHCFADISLAHEKLGFVPREKLEEALPEFAAWVRAERAVDRGAEMRRQLEARGLVT